MSRVVMIPKPGKNYEEVKGWRPINLINCIGKVMEKVVRDELQLTNRFYAHQFKCLKGRLATDAVFRAVVKIQWIMVAQGVAEWVLQDVKGGFNIVKEEKVTGRLKGSRGEEWEK